jgi:nitrate/TMAO reductase-like tetraheme cytochrome c subunit
MRLKNVRTRARDRLEKLSPSVLGLVGVGVLSFVGAMGYYAYETYDYVQHDNEFCVSCHLMVDPSERFAQSTHQELGCKACHKPSLIERSTMGLTQLVRMPTKLGVHAEVPNETCAECHIDGDPETWSQIAKSAGHEVHLGSEDRTLQGLQCVECHSRSVHVFTTTDETCGQSGCHEDRELRLGGMRDLTVHCVVCHGFSAEISEASEGDVLAPNRDTCLTCHEMQALMDLPDPDPHGGACADCHNAHVDTTPHEAVTSCVSNGCHSELDVSTHFHEEVEQTILEDCTSCHTAHDFHIDGSDCLACHEDILRESQR